MTDKEPQISLKHRSVKAIFWTLSELLFRQGFRFAIAIILARLLSPEEFGTVSMLAIFIGIGNVFIESGFSSALVQKQDITHKDESTVFWFNLLMGAFVAAFLCFAAPAIAAFFNRPVLIKLIPILAISVLVSALGSVQNTLLTKSLNFKAPMQANVAASFLSGIVVCVLAYYHYGVWALVWQTLVASLTTTCALWHLSSWRPLFVLSTASLKKLFGFGSYLMLSSLMDIAYTRSYGLVIGKFYSAYDLGIYNRAESTRQIPIDILATVMYRVAFPLFSSAANDRERLKRGMAIGLRGIMFLNVPMMSGVIATADNFVPVFFGHQWIQSVPLLQVLCISGILWPLHAINLSALKSMGYSHLFFRLEILKRTLGFMLIIVGLYYGIMGLAWSQVASGAISFWINAFYSRKFLKYGALKQTLDFLPMALFSMVMGGAVYYAGQVINLPKGQLLLTQIAIGAFIYWGLCSTFKIIAYQDIVQLLIKRNKSI